MGQDSTQVIGIIDELLSRQALEFGAVCAGMAFVLILLDWIMLATLDRSFLDIVYGSKSRIVVILGWAFASGVVGIFVTSVNVVQSNVQGALAVAVSWPVILIRLLEKSSAAVQSASEEEEEEVEE